MGQEVEDTMRPVNPFTSPPCNLYNSWNPSVAEGPKVESLGLKLSLFTIFVLIANGYFLLWKGLRESTYSLLNLALSVHYCQ